DRGNRVPPDRTATNLRTMLSLYQRAGAQVFLMDQDGGEAGAANLYQRVAGEAGIDVLPALRAPLAGVPAFLLADGRHPNAGGYALVAQALFARLQALLSAPPAARP